MLKLINLCDDCRFADWIYDSVENARCKSNPTFKTTDEGNYVNSCSAYKSRNIIKRFIEYIKSLI